MQTKTQNPAPAALAPRLLAVFCVLVGLGGLAALTLFVLLLGLDLLPARHPAPAPWPWLIDCAWLVAFAVQHSGMARFGYKRWLGRVLPAAPGRALYVALSGLLVLGLALTWQPLPGEPLWRLPAWFVTVALAGVLGTAGVLVQLDGRRFLGLRAQAGAEELRIVGPYRYIRHPLMSCTLLMLWGLPVMSPTLALLSGGLTAYILLALPLEERDLRRTFGTAYADYRRRVPALLPWRRPAPPQIHASTPA
jgi:protein-S-isoprenylcysteine O-methyltransferase Ste14